MRFWLRGPRLGPIRRGVSFGAEDFGYSKPRRQNGKVRQVGEKLDGSFVYVIRGDHNMVKIGVSTNPRARLASLQTGSAFPVSFAFIGVTPGNGYDIETEAHRILEKHQCNGEWLDCSSELAIAAVMGAASKIGQPIQILTLEQADMTIKIGTGSMPMQHQKVRLGFVGWMVVLGRTVLYSFLSMFAMVVVLGVMGTAHPEFSKEPSPLIGAIAFAIPFLCFFAAFYDTKKRRAKAAMIS